MLFIVGVICGAFGLLGWLCWEPRCAKANRNG